MANAHSRLTWPSHTCVCLYVLAVALKAARCMLENVRAGVSPSDIAVRCMYLWLVRELRVVGAAVLKHDSLGESHQPHACGCGQWCRPRVQRLQARMIMSRKSSQSSQMGSTDVASHLRSHASGFDAAIGEGAAAGLRKNAAAEAAAAALTQPRASSSHGCTTSAAVQVRGGLHLPMPMPSE